MFTKKADIAAQDAKLVRSVQDIEQKMAQVQGEAAKIQYQSSNASQQIGTAQSLSMKRIELDRIREDIMSEFSDDTDEHMYRTIKGYEESVRQAGEDIPKWTHVQGCLRATESALHDATSRLGSAEQSLMQQGRNAHVSLPIRQAQDFVDVAAKNIRRARNDAPSTLPELGGGICDEICDAVDRCSTVNTKQSMDERIRNAKMTLMDVERRIAGCVSHVMEQVHAAERQT